MRKSSSAVKNEFSFSTKTSSTGSEHTIAGTSSMRMPAKSVVKSAINNHLRYLKSLGKTHVSAQDVARALCLPTEQVKRVAVEVGAILED